jgi:integrase
MSDLSTLPRVVPLRPTDPPDEPDPETLMAWERWRTFLAASVTPETVRGYSGSVLRFLAETGCRPLQSYTEDDCAEFLGRYAARGAARHMYHGALTGFFRWARRRELLDADPMVEIVSRKPRRVQPATLTADELTRLLVAAVLDQGERVGWALLLTYTLGLRRKETAGLRWSDIREGETGPVIEIHSTKGAAERDALPLTPVALECIARLRELPPPPQVRERGPEYIVRAAPQTITRWGNRAAKAAGLPLRKTGPHRLRATLATDMLKAGVDIRVVQRLLGHLRLDSTAFYLGWAEEGEIRAAMEMLEAERAGRTR